MIQTEKVGILQHADLPPSVQKLAELFQKPIEEGNTDKCVSLIKDFLHNVGKARGSHPRGLNLAAQERMSLFTGGPVKHVINRKTHLGMMPSEYNHHSSPRINIYFLMMLVLRGHLSLLLTNCKCAQ